MKEYSTKQRDELMHFFAEHPDTQFTANTIVELLADKISKSAVYRNLSKLENEGTISRAVKEGCRESVYQYTKSEECKNSIHLACIKCGNIKHMNPKAAEHVREAVIDNDGFFIGNGVVYGLCGNCENNKQKQER